MEFNLDNSILTLKGEKPVIKNKYQFIIWKFVKPENVNWPREMKVAKELFNIYPDLEFWNNLRLNFKLNSLVWFKTFDGKKYLSNEKTMTKSNKVEILDEKIGKDEEVKKLPTLKDFLNI